MKIRTPTYPPAKLPTNRVLHPDRDRLELGLDDVPSVDAGDDVSFAGGLTFEQQIVPDRVHSGEQFGVLGRHRSDDTEQLLGVCRMLPESIHAGGVASFGVRAGNVEVFVAFLLRLRHRCEVAALGAHVFHLCKFRCVRAEWGL